MNEMSRIDQHRPEPIADADLEQNKVVDFPPLFLLFCHMHQNHGLALCTAELETILNVCQQELDQRANAE